MTRKSLRAVGEDERAPKREPMSLERAVETGDLLDIYLAQRRLIASSLQEATASVRPQLSNELNKLNGLISGEEERIAAAAAEEDARNGDADSGDEAFDASAV